MSFYVYHVDLAGLKDSIALYGATQEAAEAFVSEHCYSLVAVVSDHVVEHTEDVYQLTNHIDHPWQKNSGLIMYTVDARSTSVGDVVYDTIEREYHICMPIGFIKIDSFDPKGIVERVNTEELLEHENCS